MDPKKERLQARVPKFAAPFVESAKGREYLARMAMSKFSPEPGGRVFPADSHEETLDNIKNRREQAKVLDLEKTETTASVRQSLGNRIKATLPESEETKSEAVGELGDKTNRATRPWRTEEEEEVKRAEWAERANDIYRRQRRAKTEEELARLKRESEALSFELDQPTWSSVAENDASYSRHVYRFFGRSKNG